MPDLPVSIYQVLHPVQAPLRPVQCLSLLKSILKVYYYYVYGYVHVSTGALRKADTSDPPWLGLEVVVSHPTWVLGI